MLNKDNIRELAYLIRVEEIKELPGYDRVESARVGGWWCIVPKGQFTIGDIGIYFEIDSKVPAEHPFEFMEKRHYKVKTQKMCKSISQGLLMAPSDFGWRDRVAESDRDCVIDEKTNEVFYVDDESKFLTKKLKVTYADAEDNKRKSNGDPNAKYKSMAGRHPKLFQNKFIKWIYKKSWGKKFLFIFFGKKKDKKTGWPVWVKKTDEERIQNMPWILENKEPWIATEKIDGTSTTFTMKRHGRKFDFYICSRNVVFDKPDKNCFYDTNVYVEMSEKYHIEEVLKDFLLKSPKDIEWVTLQGETYGDGIQKRTYGLENADPKNKHCFMGFNLIDSKIGRWNSVEAEEQMKKYGVPWVPILNTNFILPDTVEELLNIATGESVCDHGMREGIVFRSQDGIQSFKAVSNEYLLKYHS